MRYYSLLILLSLFTSIPFADCQNTKHIATVFKKYQVSLQSIENQLTLVEQDSLVKKNKVQKLYSLIKNIQEQKFNLDSAFIEYEFLSKRALLDQILTKKQLKKRNRNQLKKDLLQWNYHSCHPKSDKFWHTVSRFFYNLETISNSPFQNISLLSSLHNEIMMQQEIANLILKDVTSNNEH